MVLGKEEARWCLDAIAAMRWECWSPTTFAEEFEFEPLVRGLVKTAELDESELEEFMQETDWGWLKE